MKKLLALVASIALLVPTASVAAGGNRYADSGTLELVGYYDRDGDGQLSHDDDVSFYGTAPAALMPAYGDIEIDCYQDWTSWRKPGTYVYHAGGFATAFPYTATYRLRSWVWSSGAAYCRAIAYVATGTRGYIVATVDFAVAP